jgi:hypothetical protein
MIALCPPTHSSIRSELFREAQESGRHTWLWRTINYSCYSYRPRRNFTKESPAILKQVSMFVFVFWAMAPCGLVRRYLCLGGTYCLYHQGLRYFSLRNVSTYRLTWRHNPGKNIDISTAVRTSDVINTNITNDDDVKMAGPCKIQTTDKKCT